MSAEPAESQSQVDTSGIAHAVIGRPTRWGPASRLARRLALRITRAQRRELEDMAARLTRQTDLLDEMTTRSAAAAAELAASQAVALGWRTSFEQLLGESPVTAARSMIANRDVALTRPLLDKIPAPAIVQCDVGELMISSEDEAILDHLRRTGTWEPSEGEIIAGDLRPGMTALDIGAHVGYRTVEMARLVGSSGLVIAIEPAPSNFAFLAWNVSRRNLRNVVLLPFAAGEDEGPAELAISRTNTGDNHLFRRQHEETISVGMIRLDDVLPLDLQVDFVKCDVQGYDQRALRGLEKTLRRCRPRVVVEFSPEDISQLGDDPGEVIDYYRSLGYRVGVVDAGSEGSELSNRALLLAAEGSEHGYLNLHLEPVSIVSASSGAPAG